MEALLKHFHEAVTTEADVEQLKKLILQLAFQGKLVGQESNDEPVAVLLQRIAEEKNQLIQEKKIRREKLLPAVMQEEHPYEIPSYWKWVRLGEIGDWGAGATPSRRNLEFYNGSIPWLKTGELNDGYISSSEETITELAMSKTSLRLNKPGDVLIAMYGATIGKLGILEIEATTNQACCACTPYESVFNQYLFYYLLSKRDDFRNQGAGGAQPNISRTKIIHSLFPLSPYEEQKRIVKRIQELFAICDNLKDEVKQKELNSLTLNKSVFIRIQDHTTLTQIEDLKFVIENMEHLCNTKESIDQLRNSLLSLAIQGRLVQQNPNDEPASVLLEAMKEEKNRLIKEKKIKKEKPLPEITDEDHPFELPNGWEWIKLGSIIQSANNGIYKPEKFYSEDGVMSLRMYNIQNGCIIYKNVRRVILTEDEKTIYRLVPGDILLNRVNSKELVGKAAIIEDLDEDVVYESMNMRLRFLESEVLPKYINKFLLTNMVRQELSGFAKQAIGQASINQNQIRNILVPIPPLNEQKRIIQKIDQLMALCDKLERNIEQSKQESEKLMIAVLQEALAVKEEVLN
ncbi:type I restriction enzyme S subunit [Priestia aryabhattai]|uniref:restriction endonuclease subunit S n=1 Tax=Priestia aryabhattai TaxID=412384 RepID=UPI003393F5CC